MQEAGYGLYERALPKFDRARFNSGKQPIDDFLAKMANQQQKKNVSATYILPGKLNDDGPHEIAGFITLTPVSVNSHSLSASLKGLPNGSIPVTMLSRLGVDVRYQGQGIGAELVVSALMLAADLCDRGLPTVGVVLDVLDDDAAAFYDKLEIFDRLPGTPERRFISMKACRLLRDKHFP
jgi:GNAT superfamily N-acetyltransferase